MGKNLNDFFKTELEWIVDIATGPTTLSLNFLPSFSLDTHTLFKQSNVATRCYQRGAFLGSGMAGRVSQTPTVCVLDLQCIL